MILKEDLIKKAFSFYNGGGLDRGLSSTSSPFAHNIIKYYFPFKEDPFRYRET